MVDAVDLESTDEIVMRVRVPPSAPTFYQNEALNNSLASGYRIIEQCHPFFNQQEPK